MAGFRDRIKALRRVEAGKLQANPLNWREHNDAQRDALKGILSEVGYADACIARELADGTLELLDGHLRADLDPKQKVPVLIVDLDDAEAAKVLATLDPLAAMATANQEKLAALLTDIETESAGLQAMLDEMQSSAGIGAGAGGGDDADDDEPEPVADSWQLVVACTSEDDQNALYQRLTAEGRQCRPLTL